MRLKEEGSVERLERRVMVERKEREKERERRGGRKKINQRQNESNRVMP